MIPDIRLARARDAGSPPFAEEGFVSEKISRARAEHHAYTRAIERAVEQPRIRERLGGRRQANVIASRQPPALERREVAVQRVRLHFSSNPAVVPRCVE